jgi:very-short-patch-repair endonuclease
MTPGEAAQRYRARVHRESRGSDETGFRVAFQRCESPIEQAYCLAMFQVPGVRALIGDFGPHLLPSLSGRQLTVFAQQPIIRYRADFLIVGTSERVAEPRFVIVECDGEAYHSTREQLHRDERRAAELRQTGFNIVRFKGSEIFRDPRLVVARTLHEFDGWTDEASFVRNNQLHLAMRELQRATQ